MNTNQLSPPQPDHRAGHGRDGARSQSRRWVPIIAGTVVILSVASALYSLNRPTIPDEIEGLVLFGDLPSIVVEGPVAYSQNPPVGGQHSGISLECGLYFSAVENERAVATLATGAIWVAYDPTISESALEDLKVFGEGEQDVFMTPYPDLPHPVIVTAWGAQVYPDSPTDPRIASFIRDFKNAESAPNPNLPCHEGELVGSTE